MKAEIESRLNRLVAIPDWADVFNVQTIYNDVTSNLIVWFD